MITNDAVAIIFSNLNDKTSSCLTSDRTVSAIPYASRYRLVDFSISNLVNAEISNISLLANYNYRSLVEHIGSGKDYDLARREGGISFISPYHTTQSSSVKLFSTHLEALICMKDYIDSFKEDYVILLDSDHIINIDFNDVIREHKSGGACLTMLTYEIGSSHCFKSPRMMVQTRDKVITDIVISKNCDVLHKELCINHFVVNRKYLQNLIKEALAYKFLSLTDMMMKKYLRDGYASYKYSGYFAYVADFEDYYRYSIELTENEKLRNSLLGLSERPVYTRVHNSSPVIYGDSASVRNSMIADECKINGTVINSVIFRNVCIEKGAVVKNCILFHGSRVGQNAYVDSIVTDKFVNVTDGVTLVGNKKMPFYVEKGRMI